MNPLLTRFPVTFPTLGPAVVDWIENHLCHGPGDVQGEDLRLDLEEYAWLCWAYRLQPQWLDDDTPNPEAGRRLVHRAVYCRSKGMRKSELAGMVCCAEALGPVRCDGFDAKGWPVGVPVTYPFVRIMATEEDQSSNVYDNVTYMLQNGEAGNAYHIDLGRSVQTSTRIYIKEDGGGEIVPSTSGDASKDGGKESFVASDEEHLMVSKKLRSMYRTVARNTGKRREADPWIGGFSTAWQPGEESVIEQTAQTYQEMDYEEAVVKHGVLFDHKQGEPPKIFGRNDSLMKALKTAYAPYKDSWTDFNKIVKLIRDAEDPEAEGFRFYLNIPRAGASTWLYPAEIEAVMGDVEPREGEAITVGFDGSESDDHTVLMGCRENGDLFTIGAWAPRPGDLFWRDEVNQAVDWTFENFRVVRFYGDPPYWISEMAQWARDHGTPPITEFWTNQDTKMAVATGALRSAIRRENPAERVVIDPVPLRTSELFFVNNEVVQESSGGLTLIRAHFQHARTRKVKVKFDDKTEEAFVVRKERSGSPLKIDAVPSAVLARRARDDALKENEFSEPEYSYAAWQ